MIPFRGPNPNTTVALIVDQTATTTLGTGAVAYPGRMDFQPTAPARTPDSKITLIRSP